MAATPRRFVIGAVNRRVARRIPYNRAVRALTVLCLVVGCGGPAYRLTVTEPYEVGEDATIGLQVKQVTDDDAEIVITRPDGTSVKQHAPLDAAVTRIRFAPPVPRPRAIPTFTMTGDYLVELKSGNRVLASKKLQVTIDHLNDLIPDESVSEYKPITRFTRPKQAGDKHWKVYGATYEHPFQTGARIDVVIEEPKDDMKVAWKPYEEDGTLGVIENSNVLIRERTDSASAAWKSGDWIVSMRAASLAELQRGLIAHFLARFPSKLSAK